MVASRSHLLCVLRWSQEQSTRMNLYPIQKNDESGPPDLPHRLLNVREAASFLGLSVSTLNKLRLSGDGPPYMKLGRRVLYDPRDLQSWALTRKRTHTSDSN